MHSRGRTTHKRLDTAISSALTADVTAMLRALRVSQHRIPAHKPTTYKTTRRIAIAPPLPITTAAAAGAASPALDCEAESGLGYVGNAGYNANMRC